MVGFRNSKILIRLFSSLVGTAFQVLDVKMLLSFISFCLLIPCVFDAVLVEHQVFVFILIVIITLSLKMIIFNLHRHEKDLVSLLVTLASRILALIIMMVLFCHDLTFSHHLVLQLIIPTILITDHLAFLIFLVLVFVL